MLEPPRAPRIPHSHSCHGVTLEDPYHWLRDPGYPNVQDRRVLDYLAAENSYVEACMGPHRDLVQALFEEIKARQPEEELSVPYRKSGFWYRWRFQSGAQYRQWLRAADDGGGEPQEDSPQWQVILDETELAAAHSYFRLGGMVVSPNGRYLAWTADTDGSERFTLEIKDLASGTRIDEPIRDTLGTPQWSADSGRLAYLAVNEQWRPYQARLHRVGTPLDRDRVLYEESDEAFFVGLDTTSSEAFLLITTGDHTTTEVRCLPTDDPEAEPLLIAPRRTGHDYHVDHGEGSFYVLSNAAHRNFGIYRAPQAAPAEDNWERLISGSTRHYLTWLLRRRGRLIVGERVEGLDQVRILDDDGSSHSIAFPEPSYSVDAGANPEYASPTLRLIYQSMVTPQTVYDYDLQTRALQTRKVQHIPSGYDAQSYRTERRTVVARDGAHVPVSVVYRRGLVRDGSAPAYQYGYGAYGVAIRPGFSANRLSLLDRGFVFAIAHIRGGDDLGYDWYEAGKLEQRTNTFNDFVDVARFLIREGYTSAGRMAIAGESAGGELMGAVVNQAPELWGAVAAHVPFVDVLNTMLSPDLPLTPIEWPEWGNPIEDPVAFERIRSYCPYQQLKPGHYPPMLVTAGLNDPRVTYWEPAKYVARLRTLKRDRNWLLLKTNMEAGHGGQSGRYDALHDLAEEYAFVLISLGLVHGARATQPDAAAP
ncbi:MAG: S9 family peptidase [Pseudomonadales bacterium]